MRNRTKGAVLGLFTAGALAVGAGTAFADATFDPGSGIGFVGKGDVQQAFGWNNKQLQDNVSGVDFLYEDLTAYDVTCKQNVTETFVNGAGKTVTRTVVIRNVSDASVAASYDSATATRTNRKGDVNGFKITGMTPVSQQPAPAEGDDCTMDDGSAGKVSAVVQTSTSGDTLYATHDTKSQAPVWVDGVSVYTSTTATV